MCHCKKTADSVGKMIRNLTPCLFIFLAINHLQGMGIGQLDSTLTASLQGRNQSRLLDVTIETVSLITPLVEIGWIILENNAGVTNDGGYARETGELAARSYLITNAVTLAMKYTLKRERPHRRYQPRLWNTRITPSFPSGHTASSTAVATVAAIRYPQYAAVAFLYAATSGYSQVYTGNHYLGDVLAGVAVGYLVSKLLLRSDRNNDPHLPDGYNTILPLIRLEINL